MGCMWSRVCRFHSIRYVGGADLWSTSRIIPAQPPSGISAKSGSVMPGFTRTCAPLANRGGVRGFFSFLFLLLMTLPPGSLPVKLDKGGMHHLNMMHVNFFRQHYFHYLR